MNKEDIAKGQLILENLYKKAKENTIKISSQLKENLDPIIQNIDNNKSMIGAIITSSLKKILSPEQDIRLHKITFEKGYSARSLDTKVTTPFMKKYFIKYANKETSFLTLAFRSDVEWFKKNKDQLSIRNNKEKFLEVIDLIQNNENFAEECILYIFTKLLEKENQNKQSTKNLNNLSLKNKYNIIQIIDMLKEHFEIERSSRLPVIAIYSIYEILVKNLNRYRNKKLLPLNVHTASDKHGYGDIEIYTLQNEPFEIVEIKHNIPITYDLILDIVKKINSNLIDRYYILTTYPNSFVNKKEEEKIKNFLLKLNKEKNLDIIANGIFTSLKYYLRFIDDYTEFVETYTKNLINDFKNSTEINKYHLDKWLEIIKTYENK